MALVTQVSQYAGGLTLDAMPGIGAVKNAFEAIRGRHFIKDKSVAG